MNSVPCQVGACRVGAITCEVSAMNIHSHLLARKDRDEPLTRQTFSECRWNAAGC
jgi:hypothetical protein